jgi:hypothetical protein
MANDEPQSYGSQKDWLTGKTGNHVNNPKSDPPAEHRDFYENRLDSDDSEPVRGGELNHAQRAENAQHSGTAKAEERTPTQKVTDQEGGAKRGGYFKDRDYK